MKDILKYLLFSIIALTFFDSVKEVQSCEEILLSCNVPNETVTASPCLLSLETDFCVPNRISSVNTPRLRNGSKKSSYNQRLNFVSFNSGKTINADCRYITQETSLNYHSSLMEPAYKLARLCRFII